MKRYFHPTVALATPALLVSIFELAETREKMLITLKTNDFEQLHREHQVGEGHKTVVIKKTRMTGD